MIAGQGTIAVEIFRQIDYRKIDYIFVGVGGGGMISGIAFYVKRLCPRIKIIAVQAADADSMTRSLMEGQRVELSQVVNQPFCIYFMSRASLS